MLKPAKLVMNRVTEIALFFPAILMFDANFYCEALEMYLDDFNIVLLLHYRLIG